MVEVKTDVNINIRHPIIRSPENRSIFKDMIELGISNDIAEYADQIFQEIAPTHGKNKCKSMTHFYCLYHALKEKNHGEKAPIPKDIAKIVGMPENKIYRVLTTYPIRKYISSSYIDYIPSLSEKIGIDADSIDQIVQFGKNFKIYSEVDHKSPQVTAAGVIATYISANGSEVDYNQFSTITGLSIGSIKTIQKTISDIWNRHQS